jgi:hypothetical protein
MGPRRFERPTSSLSGTRSNQLSYEPGILLALLNETVAKHREENCIATPRPVNGLSRKCGKHGLGDGKWLGDSQQYQAWLCIRFHHCSYANGEISLGLISLRPPQNTLV